MKYRTSLLAAVLLALATALPQQSSASTPAPAATAAAQSRTIFGLTITPQQHQTPEQQTTDGQACYQQAKTESGVDPAHIVKGTPSQTTGSTSSTTSNTGQMASQAASAMGGSMGGMAGGLAGMLGQAQTQYQQAPPQTQQGKPMKAFKKSFKSCLELKGYSVKKKSKG